MIQILKEQYYFTCGCEFCQTDPIRPDLALLCPNCSARASTPQPSTPSSTSTKPDADRDTWCVGCHGPLSTGQIETARRWRYRTEALLQQDEGGGDSQEVFASFEEGTKLMEKSDLTLYNIAEETCIRAIRVQNMDFLVQSVIIQLHLQRIFYHKHSLTILNSLGMLFKGLLAVGRLDEAKQIFPELIRLVRLNYGEHHNLYKYMMALITWVNISDELRMEAGRGEGSGGAEATHRTSKRKGSEWEILANLEKGVHYTIKPKRY